MLNKIYWKEKLAISSEKVGKERIFLLDDGSKINLNQFKSCPVEITCNECDKKFQITYYHIVDKKKYVCQVCNKKGNKNPFYGKKHTDRTKQSIANCNKGNKYWIGKKHKESSKEKISKYWKGKQVGDKNPFYGKKHDEKTIRTIIEKTRMWRESLTDDDKKKLSKIHSESQKKLQKADPEIYRKNKQKAAYAAAKNHKKYQMNNLEKDVQKVLKNIGIEMKYSVIFCHKQFDFGIKNKKILLEVQGDYWHGNPKIYSDLNDIQKINIERDKIKEEIARNHGFRLFYIWESDFRNKDFSVFMEIKKLLD